MLIVHFFVSYAHVNLYHFFSSSWCRGLVVASACGSSWTFLFNLFHNCLEFMLIPENIALVSFESNTICQTSLFNDIIREFTFNGLLNHILSVIMFLFSC